MLENPSLGICLETLQEKLYEYLKSQKVEIAPNGKFKCINPAHEDSTPSCNIVPNDPVFHCHGCGLSGNIFHAANMLEGLPQSGPGFLNVTVKKLCEQFGIQPPELEMTPEQQALAEIYQAYQEAYILIRCSRNKHNEARYDELFKNRNWDISIGEKFGVGIVESFNKFINDLKNRGVSDQTLRKSGLYRPDMFNENTFIFTICDERGTPVGFSARDMKHETDPTTHQSKYINTSQDCPIYRKREILYGFHLAKTPSREKGLIVVEGYADAITMHEKGIHNVVAIGGTSLTAEHVQLILRSGISKVILCLDNDNGGQLAVERILDNVIANQQLQVDIVQLPEGLDPDDYLKVALPTNARELWEGLQKMSCFQWRITHFDSATSSEEIAEKMIPLIITEPNIIRREKMIKELADNTGVRLIAIQSEVDRIGRLEEFKNSERIRSIANQAIKELRKNPAAAKEIFGSYRDMIEQFQAADSMDSVGAVETVEAFDAMTENWKHRMDHIVGIPVGWKALDEAINGFQEGRAVGIGGKPNHGKSSFVSSIAWNVAKNLNNNTVVLFHSTDDNRDTVLARLVAIDQELPMNFVTNPMRYINGKNPKEARVLQEKWEMGKKSIKDLLLSGKLVVKDSTHGTTLGYTETMIKYYKERHPKSKFLTVFDNFHKAQDFAEWDERIRFKKMSGLIKNLSEKYWVAMLATMEYTKLPIGQRPENSDLSETAQMEYDLSVIMHVYNELKDIGPERSKLVTINQQGTTEERDPIISVKVGKNKQAVFADSLYFYFRPTIGKFQECPASHAVSLMKPDPTKGQGTMGKLGQNK
jgi:DNA primase catalytic core